MNDIVVIYDEMALPPGKIRLREKDLVVDIKECKVLLTILKMTKLKEFV